MILTDSNYYTEKADDEYMSNSQFGEWIKCPAKAHAKYVSKEIPKGDTDIYFLGRYAHSIIEGDREHEAFIEKNKELIFAKTGKNKGQKKKDFLIADNNISLALQNKTIKRSLSGDHEVILTFNFAGLKWKCRLDVINDKNKIPFFTDFKYMSQIDDSWRTYYKTTEGSFVTYPILEETEELSVVNRRVPFYEVFDYWRQVAIYQYALKENKGIDFLPFITTITKTTKNVLGINVPNISVISFENRSRIEKELHDTKNACFFIKQWKNGESKPYGCGECDYCRYKKLKEYNSITEAKSIF